METESINILEEQPRAQISLWDIFSAYFMIGLTAFGMAIIQKIRTMVTDKHWLSEEEVNEGMGMVQLYPGPLMVDFSAYVGYKLRGVIGAILATTGFILPTFVLMSVLSAFYFSAGNLPWVHPLFHGGGSTGGGYRAQRHPGDGGAQHPDPHTGSHHAAGFWRFIIQSQFNFDRAGCAGVGRLADPPGSGRGENSRGRQTGCKGGTRFVRNAGQVSGRWWRSF